MSKRSIRDFDLKVGTKFYGDKDKIFKFGYQSDFDRNLQMPIWDNKSIYTFSNTADIDKIASSNNADNQTISIHGLDANFNHVSQDVILNGQTAVTLATPLIRVYRAYNKSATELQGDVSIAISSATFSGGAVADATELRAKITQGNEQTAMAIYSVKAGHTLYLARWTVDVKRRGSTGDESVLAFLKVRENNQTFRVREFSTLHVEGGSIEKIRKYFLKIPEKSDIMIEVLNDSASNGVISATFEGILIKN